MNTGSTNGVSSGKVAVAVGRAQAHPDPEVPTKAKRRQFSAEYKLRILREADRCEPGDLGALLRREGLYSSHLVDWRRQRAQGELAGLQPRQRGRRAQDPERRRLAELERDNRRLRKQLARAELIIDVQKKVSGLLGIPLRSPGRNGDER